MTKPILSNAKNPADDVFPPNTTETNHLHIALLLLHLLPSPNFSLLSYFLTFFSQVALVREENGVGIDDPSRMFGGRIFWGRTSLSNSTSGNAANSSMDDTIFNTTQTRREGKVLMMTGSCAAVLRFRKDCLSSTMRRWAYFSVPSTDATVSERTYCHPPIRALFPHYWIVMRVRARFPLLRRLQGGKRRK